MAHHVIGMVLCIREVAAQPLVDGKPGEFSEIPRGVRILERS